MRKFIIAAVAVAALAVPTLAIAGGGNSDAANTCKQGGWQNLVRQDGTGFADQGPCVSYVVNGGVPKAKAAPSTAVFEPTFDYNVNSCSVKVPYTPGLDTRLYGVNGYSEDAPITHDVTITAGLAGVAGTAQQFWVGYKAQPGYVNSNPGAGTSHIDFYNGDLVADCGATGDVTWDYQGIVTGTVSFNANATGGSLDYQNSNGMWLHGVVSSYRQIDAHTAVFAGTITDGSLDYTERHAGTDYFFAKVVDGGSKGDQIAVLANEGPTDASGDYDMSKGAGIVTDGNLVVH
jgi:hypothetical protein